LWQNSKVQLEISIAPKFSINGRMIPTNPESCRIESQIITCGLTARVVRHIRKAQRRDWLRAMILGASDGLVSTAALLMGIAAASNNFRTLLLAGVAELVSGALSMASGEWMSMATQRDAENADIQTEIDAQNAGPESQQIELDELRDIYIARGVDRDTATQVAIQLSARDVIATHARDEYGIDIYKLSNPLQASVASCVSFAIGGSIPLITTIFMPTPLGRLIACLVSAVIGLIVLGILGAELSSGNLLKGAIRVLAGGSLALGVTYGIGKLME
jgi:VIT1/CCC1 family predicted Fe2+/Mn2+ transporter